MWRLNIKLEQPPDNLFSTEALRLRASGLLFAARRVGGVREGMVDAELPC